MGKGGAGLKGAKAEFRHKDIMSGTSAGPAERYEIPIRSDSDHFCYRHGFVAGVNAGGTGQSGAKADVMMKTNLSGARVGEAERYDTATFA